MLTRRHYFHVTLIKDATPRHFLRRRHAAPFVTCRRMRVCLAMRAALLPSVMFECDIFAGADYLMF